MNPFDVAVIAILVVSALFAFVRGFLTEALSIVVWIGAALVAYYAFPYVLPLAQGLTHQLWIAQASTAVGVFVVALIVLAVLSSSISSRIRGSALGPVDRMLGLFYGLARGAVIVCLVYIGMTSLIAEADRPDWFTQAQSLPALARGSQILAQLLPASAKNLATQTVDAGRRATQTPVDILREETRPILPSPALPPTAAGGAVQLPQTSGATSGPVPDPALPTQAAPAPAPAGPKRAGTSGEVERLMRPPAPAPAQSAPAASYTPDARKEMDRTIHSLQ